MQRYGRKVLICTKKLSNGIIETFRVVVKSEKVESAKQEYKRQGYKVF